MPSRILNLEQLVGDWKTNHNFTVKFDKDSSPQSIDPTRLTLIELSRFISDHEVYSHETRQRKLKEWLYITQIDGESFVPSNGHCWSCEADLVRYYSHTGHYSGSECPFCHYEFT